MKINMLPFVFIAGVGLAFGAKAAGLALIVLVIVSIVL